jgi:MoxR-like ATPase
MTDDGSDFWIYRGQGSPAVVPPKQPRLIPALERGRLNDPALYEAADELVDAVNVALHLDRPLLLTGEAGTGKTQLASSLAWELNYPFLKFETKSTSTAIDLFYTYNALAQFHVAQVEAQRAARRASAPGDGAALGLRYIRYNALGAAILCANPRDVVTHLLPPGFMHPGAPVRSVVLIDEVDKAPRDLPNDILSALDDMSFLIPELDNARVQADPALRPIVVFTSNSEKALPDPFLRRCIYYNIPFPGERDLRKIVANRLVAQAERDGLLDDALKLLDRIRQAPGLRKKPATAELLDWLQALGRLRGSADSNPLRDAPAAQLLGTLVCLVKNDEDFNRSRIDDPRPVNKVLQEWIRTRT